jgi:hypothetical protein
VKVMTRVKVPQMAGIRQSVEVQHGWRALGRMLRRGLHGSKNWVLELDSSGEHQSVWAKAGKVFIVLIPLWLILSAATGGPERGGHSVSVFQSVVAALVVTFAGLAVFSARERRLGREEPWADFDPIGTESDSAASSTLVDTPSEEETQVIENAQVAGLDSGDAGDGSMGIPDDSAESSENETAVLHGMPQQAISAEAETAVIPGPEAPTQVLQHEVHQAIPAGTDGDKTPDPFESIAAVVSEFREKDVQQATEVEPISLVKPHIPIVRQVDEQATSEWTKVDVSGSTESDDGLLEDEPTTPLRATVQEVVHNTLDATESSQVSDRIEVVQQPLQGVLQVQFAAPGPYPMADEPVHEDWWVTPPDVEPEQEEDPDPEPSRPEVAPEPQQPATAALELPPALAPEEPQEPPLGRPQVVLNYLASQAPKSGFTTEEKDRARTDVIAWIREEVSSNRMSRADASRMLGVDPSTVTRWVSDDPWAG